MPVKMTDHKWCGAALIVLYLIAAISGLILVTIIQPQGGDPLIFEMGKNCALVAFMIIACKWFLPQDSNGYRSLSGWIRYSAFTRRQHLLRQVY